MSKPISLYPPVLVDGSGAGVVSQAGGVVLAERVRAAGLGTGLSAAVAPWRKPLAGHDGSSTLSVVPLGWKGLAVL